MGTRGKLVVGFLLIQIGLIYYYNSQLPKLDAPTNYYRARRDVSTAPPTPSAQAAAPIVQPVGPRNDPLSPPQVHTRPSPAPEPAIIIPQGSTSRRKSWDIPDLTGLVNQQIIDPWAYLQGPVSGNPRQEDQPKVSIFNVQKGANEVGFMAAEKLWGNVRDPSREILEVYVIPHSHCDAGWLKTFERYYVEEVEKILTTLTSALTKNPNRKFSWVETSFLSRWWRDQSSEVKSRFKKLFNNQQLEFLMGGWVSSDEASVTYMQSINQLSDGHRFLQKHFGASALPSVGWQVDPFGFSQVTPYILSQMCFDAHVGWRISEPEMETYLHQHTLEFVWRSSPSLQETSDILMHLLPWSYNAQDVFKFKRAFTSAQIPDLATQLANSFIFRGQFFDSDTLMWLWGGDFEFQNAEMMFDNMDAMIEYINSHPEFRVHVQYATPKEYFQVLNKKNFKFPMRQKDFFPYRAGEVNWWTGYYTSRPVLKRATRELDALQRSAEMVYSLARLSAQDYFSEKQWKAHFNALEELRNVQGILQHHDAITGTMRQMVLNDYFEMISRATTLVQAMLKDLYPLLIVNQRALDASSIPLELNIGSFRKLPNYATDVGVLSLLNSLPWEIKQYVKVPVPTAYYRIIDATGASVASAVLPVWSGNGVSASFNLFFQAELEAVGVRNYFLVADNSRKFDTVLYQSSEANIDFSSTLVQSKKQYLKTLSIENGELRLEFTQDKGLKTIVDLHTQQQTDVTQSYHEYQSDRAWGNHYTFKPLNNRPNPVTPVGTAYLLVQTPLVSEFHRRVSPIVWQSYRLFTGSDFSFIEIEDVVGPPTQSTDFVTRFHTPLATKGRFFTDDSGLETLERLFNPDILMSGNYYPMVYSAFIRDNSRRDSLGHPLQFTYLSNTAHGVTSPEEGVLEVMLHRHALQTIANGESLSETTVATIQSWLLVRPQEHFYRQNLAMMLNFPPTQFSSAPLSLATATASLEAQRTWLNGQFPPEVFMPNFQHYDDSFPENKLVVRVNHLKQSDGIDYFDSVYLKANGESTSVPLKDLFGSKLYSVSGIRERTLSMNRDPEECARFHWHDSAEASHAPKNGLIVGNPNSSSNATLHTGLVNLRPMAIRSFFVNAKSNFS